MNNKYELSDEGKAKNRRIEIEINY